MHPLTRLGLALLRRWPQPYTRLKEKTVKATLENTDGYEFVSIDIPVSPSIVIIPEILEMSCIGVDGEKIPLELPPCTGRVFEIETVKYREKGKETL